MKSMKGILTIIIVLLLAAGLSPLYAQKADKDKAKKEPPKEDVLAALDEEQPLPPAEKTPFTFSFGGWLTPVIIDQRDGGSITTSATSLKLWAQTAITQNSFLYVRGRDVFTRIIAISGSGSGIDKTDNLYDLDVAFFEWMSEKRTARFSAGRKFFLIGTGIVFNGRGDGAEFNIYSSIADIKLFGAYTGLLKKDVNPYALSSRDISNGAKRIFAGGTIDKSFSNQTVYLLGMAQVDLGDENAGEKTRYQSQYYGIGLKGTVGAASYYGEFIYEMGKSYLAATGDQKSISAMAGTLGINYFLSMAMNPVLMFQYAYGSGDKDRTSYRTPNGNNAGSDNGFIYFGTFLGGNALRPLLSNLHVARGGFSIVPFYSSPSPAMKRMSLSVKYDYYMKDKPDSGINAGAAPLAKRFVGQGVDASLHWAVYYDMSVFVTYGLFLPGSAYSSSTKNSNFIMGGLNIVF